MSQDWQTRPISPVCEVLRPGTHRPSEIIARKHECGEPTAFAYPAMGNGWMALCWKHGQKHLPHAFKIEDLIQRGETFEGVEA